MGLKFNEPDTEQAYLEALNLCFPGWGDRRQYAWVMNRSVGGPPPDRMTLHLGAEMVAGSAVSYRWLSGPRGRILVGMMTGSWTLPVARGYGCFSRIIMESVALTTRKGGAVLLAFVTEDNASFRRLRDSGAALFSTAYFESGDSPGSSRAKAKAAAASGVETEMFGRHRYGDAWSVEYDLDSWKGQLIDRAFPSESVRVGNDSLALVDHGSNPGITRLLALYSDGEDPGESLQALASYAAQDKRRLVGFFIDSAMTRAAEEVGFKVRQGYLTALVADSAALANGLGVAESWSGADSQLADPLSPWSLGIFGFHSGDRM